MCHVCRRFPSRMEFVECVLVGVGVAVTHVEWFLDKQVCTLNSADPFGLRILTCLMASIVCGVSSMSRKRWNREIKSSKE